MTRLLIFTVAYLAATCPAPAETIVLRPDPCPTAAEQPLIIDLGDVELFNEQPEDSLGSVFIIYPPVREGWASARILMRFDLETPPAPQPALECPRPRLFQVPR